MSNLHFSLAPSSLDLFLSSPQRTLLKGEISEMMHTIWIDPIHFSHAKNPNLNEIQKESREQKGQKSDGGVTRANRMVCRRGHWRYDEDAQLKHLVSLYGPRNWNMIALQIKGRSGKSCRLRWFNQLDPRINKKPFTKEEEKRIKEAHKVYGNKWAKIARLLDGRTDNAVKNHWHIMKAREEKQKLLNSAARANFNFGRRTSMIMMHHHHHHVHDHHGHVHHHGNDDGHRSAASTCTDLSPSTSAFHQKGTFEERIWMCARDGGSTVVMKKSKMEELSGPSDSNSEMSAGSESVNNNGNSGKLNLPFFNFMGVDVETS